MIDKVVVQYRDGRIIKGHLRNFSEKADNILVMEKDDGEEIKIPVNTLKAIFFVRYFEGKKNYSEKKIYGISEKRGVRLFVKFRDGESFVGFLSGDVPWDRKKGFYISKKSTDQNGFFLIPVDKESNNIKVFVVLSAIEDVSVMN
ncbi:hypothetical protein BMS3Abin07_00252 [bacterium BMS3Abin07]|nr:hypothetical protein BMS3Abin07_00252 [bacterium BMS3Abin07]GBE32308.1 hypothetical protein BMS3Bbin05_01218 [bacterium BMS3Bbin05]HDO23082.1 hypothetical protein [Nitrospirota bacterium]HDZ87876.1 hypothetical protein [Nitrospirota bacterium]